MKNRVLVFITIFLFFVGSNLTTNAQDNKYLYSEELQQAYTNRTEEEMKISSYLFSQIFRYEKAITDGYSVTKAIKNFNSKQNLIDEQQRISIRIRFNPGTSAGVLEIRKIIEESGGHLSKEEIGHNDCTEIYAWMPVDKIKNLSTVSDVAFIELVFKPIFNVTTAGDIQLNAANVRATMNITGEWYDLGVPNKIGVMSDGVKNIAQVEAAFELNAVNVLHEGDANGNEGTAMLEIVHDIAPGAQLYFSGVDENYSLSLRAQRISELENYGCNIIVDDFWLSDESFFSDETQLGTTIRNFINNGNVYVTAGGNYRKSCVAGTTLFTNSYHIFPSGLDYYPITISQNNQLICLQWATRWSNPTQDLDLEIYNLSGILVYYSDDTQSYTRPPYENVQIPSGSYRIKIKRKIASDGVQFKIVVPNTDFITGTMTGQIFGIAGYPNVISVAAYQADDQTITSDYSSNGPAYMYSTEQQQWTTQQGPTITATSGVETFVGITGMWPAGDPIFSGTSASAPHVAGLAALYFDKLNRIENLNKSNFDFINDLKLSGTTIGSGTTGGTWNNKSGFGKADILAAINRGLLTVATPVITPPGDIYPPPSLQISVSCATQGATIKYTDNGSDPSQTNGTQYSAPFIITSSKTIKAKAFKTGYNESGVATEVYIISTIQAIATVTPGGGQYPATTKITISWPSDYECWYTRTEGENPSEPPAPQTNGYWTYPNPCVWDLNFAYKYYMKFQLKRNGQWGPIVYVQYDIKPETRIAQIDDEIVGGNNSFGIWHRWENNNWQSYPAHLFIRPPTSENWFLKAKQDFKEPTVPRKYRVWIKSPPGENYFVNHAQVPISTNTSSVLAHFKQAYDATVKNNLEGNYPVNSRYFWFMDPWFMDDNSDPKGIRNRGIGTLTEIPIAFSTTPNLTTNSGFMGVFLNQGGPNWGLPYYSVKTNLTQDITLYNTGNPAGRNHHFIFQNWGGTKVQFQNANALQTGIVFTNVDPVAYALYKGTQLSQTSSAYNTNGQRKAVKMNSGYNPIYNVYESIGKVWLESSTDNGQTWRIENNGQSISGGAGGKCPSITIDQSRVILVITYQELISGSSSSKIKLYSYSYDTQQLNFIEEFIINNSSTLNLNPVTNLGNDLTIVTTYEYNGAINCRFGFWYSINPLPHIDADWSMTTYQLFGNIYSNSSITVGCESNPCSTKYHLVATKNNTYDRSDIVYKKFRIQRAYSSGGSYPPGCNGPNPNDPNCAWPIEEIIESNVSAGSGGSPMNIRPTISLANNYPVVSWITGYYAGPNEINYSRVLTRRGPAWGSTYQCGYQTKYVNNNSASITTEKTVIVYSEMNPAIVSKWIKRTGTSYNTPQNLSHSGIQTQVLSGSDYQYMTAMVFNNNSVPYYFIKSTTDFSYTPPPQDGGGLNKITDTDTLLTYGRSGIADINGIEFIFNIGDIFVGDSIINFIEIPDTILYSSTEELNQSTKTEDFHLNSNTLFLFTNFYEVVQKANPDTALTENDAVNFKAELVNSASGNVIGTFDNLTYNKNNLEKYASIDYEVDCSGITPGDYYLRLVTTVTGEAGYSLANVVNDNTTLAKKNYSRVNIEGSEIPITYALEQNYPNPFNPATTIRYQIPKEGMVTLKVYDILGAEVVTLVNEEKIAGKYEVNFDASRLASGVYLYRIKANDFISTKKMVFLK